MEGSCGILGERAQLAVRPSNDDHIAVRLAEPELQVVCQRIDLDRFEHLGLCVNRTLVGLLDCLGQEPQDNAVSVRLGCRTSGRWSGQTSFFVGDAVWAMGAQASWY